MMDKNPDLVALQEMFEEGGLKKVYQCGYLAAEFDKSDKQRSYPTDDPDRCPKCGHLASSGSRDEKTGKWIATCSSCSANWESQPLDV